MELESSLLPVPAGSAALSVSWRARSRQEQIRDHHRAQRRGSSRRHKRLLTLLQEGVSWFHSLLCSAPLRASDVVTQQGPGLTEIAFIHALLRQSMTRSARDYHGPYLAVIAALSLTIPPGVLPIADEVIEWSAASSSRSAPNQHMTAPGARLHKRLCQYGRLGDYCWRRPDHDRRSSGLTSVEGIACSTRAK